MDKDRGLGPSLEEMRGWKFVAIGKTFVVGLELRRSVKPLESIDLALRFRFPLLRLKQLYRDFIRQLISDANIQIGLKFDVKSEDVNMALQTHWLM